MGLSFSAIVTIVVILYLFSSIKVLAEYERGVIFRLGRLLGHEKGPGLVLVFAPIDRMVDLSPAMSLPSRRPWKAIIISGKPVPPSPWPARPGSWATNVWQRSLARPCSPCCWTPRSMRPIRRSGTPHCRPW